MLLGFELRYLSRDPLALVLTLLAPVLLYPLMMGGFAKVSRDDQQTTADAELRVVAEGETATRIQAGAERVTVLSEGELIQKSDDGGVHVIVRNDEAGRPRVLEYRGSAWESREARDRVETVLTAWQDEARATHWADIGMPVAPEAVLEVRSHDVAGDAQRQAMRLGQLLPGMLVFLVMSSGLYVALDLFAGEKERGTLETLLTSRVDRGAVLAAKTAVVCLATLASVGSSLFTLWLTVQSGLVDISALGGVGMGINAAVLLKAGVLLTPLSLVLSAILVVGAAWARDYRQGQALGLPLLLCGIAPAGLAAVPDLQLGAALALVPISGISLALRDALAGELDPALGVLALVAAVGHAALGMALAGRLIGREDVLLGGGSARRDPDRLGREAAIVFLVALILFWFFGQLAQSRDLVWGLAFSQVVILGGTAVGAVFVLNQGLRSLWRLRAPRVADLGLGLLAGIGCTGLGDLVAKAQAPFLPTSSAFTEQFAAAFNVDLPMWAMILVFAVQPAIFEEILFRGTLLGLVRKSLSPWAQALVVGLLFGLIHFSVFRFFPTGVLGVALTAACIRSGSIAVPMLMHFLNNGILVGASHPDLEGLLPVEELPLWWDIAGTALVVGSVALMGRRR